MKTSTIEQEKAAEYATDKERWSAFIRRDPKGEGKFFIAVKTTGIYCRSSCTARRPKRENVVFYSSCEEAERAGFRPCKRCQPNGPALAEEYATKVAAACRRIETAAEAPSLDALAKGAGMSRFHFHRVFTRLAGLTPKAYALAHRADRVRHELPKRNTVTEAIYNSGFNSNGRFYAQSARMLGMRPRSFRLGGAGEAIRFAAAKCSLGWVQVAASEKGVCSIMLDDDPKKLERELQRRFSRAQLLGGDKSFERIIGKVVSFVEAPKLGLDLPLDVRGTAFQRRVWRALCEIPVGSTSSYAEVARRLGTPKAVRAVAGACAANRIALAIPCHRVVRTGGGLAGYRWGVQRKRALLDREKKT